MDTLDAEQDPRRRHKADTVFFICGFNTMGEFSVVSLFGFLTGMQRSVQLLKARWGKFSEILSVVF